MRKDQERYLTFLSVVISIGHPLLRIPSSLAHYKKKKFVVIKKKKSKFTKKMMHLPYLHYMWHKFFNKKKKKFI